MSNCFFPQAKLIEALPLHRGSETHQRTVSSNSNTSVFKPPQSNSASTFTLPQSTKNLGFKPPHHSLNTSNFKSPQSVEGLNLKLPQSANNSNFKPPTQNTNTSSFKPLQSSNLSSTGPPQQAKLGDGSSGVSGAGYKTGNFYSSGPRQTPLPAAAATASASYASVEKQPPRPPDSTSGPPVKKPAISVRGRCVSHSAERFRVEVSYHAELIAVFKNIPSRNYG